MKRLPYVAVVAVVAAACGRSTQVETGPEDQFYRPTGMGVYAGTLVVASSNSDLRFDPGSGGTVIAVEPDAAGTPRLAGTLAIQSFAGQMAIADPALCPRLADPAAGALAVLPVRGADRIYRVRVAPGGALSCDGCDVPIDTTQVADPFAVGLACDAQRARAYVGYLRSDLNQTFVTELDLGTPASDPGAVKTRAVASLGQVNAFAFDPEIQRLYFTTTVSSGATALQWIDLAGGCAFTACGVGATASIPQGVELRGMALSSIATSPRRAYFTARIYDPVVATTAGVAVGDFDGLLLVADLVETLTGGLEVRIVRQLSVGFGAADLLRLPTPQGVRTGQRDVVVVLAADEGVVWIYDDETGQLASFGRDAVGRPLVGRAPFGLATDPAPPPGATAAQVYVGSFEESFVTRIDVPYDDPAAACMVADPAGCVGDPGAAPRRISGGTR